MGWRKWVRTEETSVLRVGVKSFTRQGCSDLGNGVVEWKEPWLGSEMDSHHHSLPSG